MIRRLWDALRRRRAGQAAGRPLRPNELRRDVVRAERLRQEARQTDAAARAARLAHHEERAARERTPAPLAERAPAERALRNHLMSRSSLRRAWLLKEVLGPPVALRRPDGFNHSRGAG